MTSDREAWSEVEVPGAPPPAGAYSRAVRAGGLLFVSGQVPRSFETGALLGDDVASQTRGAFDNLRRVLEAAGATLADVVSLTVHLQHGDDWAAFDEAFREQLSPPYPSRTVVGADLRGVLVELTAIALVPQG